jgi:hypothetical protein
MYVCRSMPRTQLIFTKLDHWSEWSWYRIRFNSCTLPIRLTVAPSLPRALSSKIFNYIVLGAVSNKKSRKLNINKCIEVGFSAKQYDVADFIWWRFGESYTPVVDNLNCIVIIDFDDNHIRLHLSIFIRWALCSDKPRRKVYELRVDIYQEGALVLYSVVNLVIWIDCNPNGTLSCACIDS